MSNIYEQIQRIQDLQQKRATLASEFDAITKRIEREPGVTGLKTRSANLLKAMDKVDADLSAARNVSVDDDESVSFESGDHSVKSRYGTKASGDKYKLGKFVAEGLKAWSGSGSTNGGAFSNPEYASYFFDRLAAKSVGLASGFRVLTTARDSLVVPRVTSDAASAWTSEAGTITPTDSGADQITATPRKLAVLTQLSNEVIRDSDPAVLDVLGMSLARSLALKLDLGFFEGSGSAPEIRGMKNVVGTQSHSMGTNGAALTNLDPFAEAIGMLEESNATATAIVMHPRTWKAALKLKEQTSGNNKPLLQESAGAGTAGVRRSIYGVPVFLSSQLSITETQGTANNASSAYVYEASQVVAVMRQQTELATDSSRLFNSDQSELRAILRADMVVPNPAAVVRIAGIIP